MSDIKVGKKTSLKLTTNMSAKRCSDYDEDCSDVKCPVSCWLGSEHLGRADGYCPISQNAN